MTTDLSKKDLELIEDIIVRAISSYGDRIQDDRLRAALIAAHRAKPIRLEDLLITCHHDFYHDVIAGAYRNFQPETGTFKNDWTAQHAEPKRRYPWELLDEEEDPDEYEDYHSTY